jgi:hypothetical protein
MTRPAYVIAFTTTDFAQDNVPKPLDLEYTPTNSPLIPFTQESIITSPYHQIPQPTTQHITMSALSPTGPSQPTQDQAYETPGNPASANPAEKSAPGFNASDNSASVDQRIPQKQASDAAGHHNAKFEEGAGVHGAPAGEEAKGLSYEDVGRHKELDGEQMAAPGEGKVAEAVVKGGKGMGGGGSEPSFTSDLDRWVTDERVRRSVKLY